MEKTFYTKLTYECKIPDEYRPLRLEQSETVWDMDMVDLLDMFHTIAIGATYDQTTFEDALVEYLEGRGYTVTPMTKDSDEIGMG